MFIPIVTSLTETITYLWKRSRRKPNGKDQAGTTTVFRRRLRNNLRRNNA